MPRSVFGLLVALRIRYAILLSLSALLACGGVASSPGNTTVHSGAESSPAAAPRLVVAVVYDQLSSDTLLRCLPLLDPEGAVRTALEKGLYFERGCFPYAATYTAPGHATIHTGTAPFEHGVTANEVLDVRTGSVRQAIDDGRHEVFGREGVRAGPSLLQVDTVGDALKAATGSRAKVASISHKDRAAILSGGKQPDLVLWYDKQLPGFTTSRYYAEALPAWLVRWQDAHPVAGAYAGWEPLDPERLRALLGPDAAPGEGDYQGFGTVFPHDPRQTRQPASAFRLTPQAGEHMLELAREVVRQLGLGADDTPDLLALSLSGTDYAGHVFGPDSWEYTDHLVRVDLALGRFLRELSRQTRVAWLLTSDHGVAPLPEKLGSERIHPDELLRAVDAGLDRELGKGDWVAAYSAPFIYLSEAARSHPDRARVLSLARDILNGIDSVAAAYPVRGLSASRGSNDPLERAVALSVHPDAPGDLFLVPGKNRVIQEDTVPGSGTTHGTPWEYDRQVPVFVVAPGLEGSSARRRSEEVDQRRLAPTLCRLLGIDPPASAKMAPLPGLR